LCASQNRPATNGCCVPVARDTQVALYSRRSCSPADAISGSSASRREAERARTPPAAHADAKSTPPERIGSTKHAASHEREAVARELGARIRPVARARTCCPSVRPRCAAEWQARFGDQRVERSSLRRSRLARRHRCSAVLRDRDEQHQPSDTLSTSVRAGRAHRRAARTVDVAVGRSRAYRRRPPRDQRAPKRHAVRASITKSRDFVVTPDASRVVTPTTRRPHIGPRASTRERHACAESRAKQDVVEARSSTLYAGRTRPLAALARRCAAIDCGRSRSSFSRRAPTTVRASRPTRTSRRTSAECRASNLRAQPEVRLEQRERAGLHRLADCSRGKCSRSISVTLRPLSPGSRLPSHRRAHHDDDDVRMRGHRMSRV